MNLSESHTFHKKDELEDGEGQKEGESRIGEVTGELKHAGEEPAHIDDEPSPRTVPEAS